MSNLLRAAAISISFSVGGCAIHPLPEDVTGVPTYMIARKIRCEARAAIKDNLTDWLKAVPNDPVANQLGIEFDNGTRPLNTFRDNLFRGPVRAIIQKFENSAIAYNFTFDMTEMNNLDATLDLIWPFSRGAGSAAIGAGIDRTRENIRTFTITDTFIELFTNVKDDYCSEFSPGRNYLYPITGTIGVGEMINTFVELSLFANLSAPDPTKGGPPTMGDTIAFTTKLSGSATPKIVLTPIPKQFQVMDASLAGAATRIDVHKVIVGLALPPPSAAKAIPSAQSTTGFLVNARGTPAELTAAHTVEQIIIRFELARPGVVVIPSP